MIHEELADNSHFAAELLNGKSGGTRREVEISFFVWNINEIDVINQRFNLRFNIYASWDEDVANISVQNNTSRYEKSMFAWDPQLRFTNCYERSDDYENWYRVSSKKDNSNMKPSELHSSQHTVVRVMYCQSIQAWFHEGFEMGNFPFDLQHLHIGVTSAWDHEAVALSFDKQQSSRVSSTSLNSQTWTMSDPRLLSYNSDWDTKSLPLLSRSTDSASGARYSRAYLALTVSRRPNFILWNIMLIMALVGSLSFATFALDPNELGDRQAVVLTLVLTTVAFKFVTTTMMPEISYVTMMDVVIYSCMLLQAFMMLCICIVANMDDEDQQFYDNCTFITLGVGWLGVLIWFTIRSFHSSKTRERYVAICNRKFHETQHAHGDTNYSAKGSGRGVYYSAATVHSLG